MNGQDKKNICTDAEEPDFVVVGQPIDGLILNEMKRKTTNCTGK